MQGFKSFPDKIKLTFGKNVTVIVGPNGSGKSNISDAVRWALGEQSSKALRGGKMEDVIFNGTSGRNAHGYAEVRLIIDNSDGVLVSTEPEKPFGDEVTVSRKYYRSGESEYRINSELVRLRDIHEMFMDTGLGRDGYSIIGQGRIAEIVSAKAAQRREIFEEAAGISKFRFRKEEAEKRLELAKDNMLRLTDILSELEGRVGPLKVQSEKAEKFLKLAEKRKSLELSLWVENIRKLQKKIAEQEDKILLASDDYERAEKEYNDIEKNIDDIFDNIQRLSAQAEDMRRQAKEVDERVKEDQAKIAVLRNDIMHNERSMEKTEEEIALFGNENEDIEKSCAGIEGEIDEIEQLRKELEGKKGEAEDRLGELDGNEKLLAESLNEIDEKVTAADGEYNRINVKMALASGDVAKYKERLELLDQSGKEREEKLILLKKELRECEELLEEIDDNIESLENSAKGIRMKTGARGERLEKIEEYRRKKNKEAEDKLHRAALLEDLEKNMEGLAGSVKYVLNQAKNGFLPGICGAVSGILSAPPEYALAIETALGGALQNIVVSDEETAKKAIAKLKESGAGRATFLPLTSVKGSKLNEAGIDKCRGFVGFAYRLVESEEKYAGIVLSLLGRIVVAENIDDAVNMAKKYGYSFRIVTLDGQLINAGGSMTGGSVVKNAGLLSRKVEIEKLKVQAGEIRKEIAKSEPEYKELSEEIAALNAQLTAIESEKKTCGEDRIRCEAEEKRVRIALDDIQKSGDDNIKQKELLGTALREAERALEEYKSGLENAQKELEELRSERESQKERITALQSEKSLIITEISDGKVKIADIEKDIEVRKLSLEQMKKQSEERGEKVRLGKEEIVRLKKENEGIEEEIKQVEEKAKEMMSGAADMENRVSELLKERMLLEGETSKLRNSQKEVSVKKEGLSAELVRQEESKKKYQGERDGLIERMWNEYETTLTQAEEQAAKIEDYSEAQRKLSEIRGSIKSLGNVNLSAIEEYKEVSERYEFLKGQLDDVEKSRNEILSLIDKLVKQMRDMFRDKFTRISANFSEIFSELFEGGSGSLKLTDSEDILEAGIEIYAAPPGKIINSLSSLSGGEQALVAIAVYFAILKESPAPFCMLDEIEAALDDVNVARYAQYLRKMNEKIQFIAVSHRRGTMERADVLYGVTMQERGVSKILQLNVSDVESKLNMKV